ncbi:MAG: HDOD domain-containing protein [Myxococcota bacterium]|nr:HDOD domain-containing protein [Myxococcota bacterium]
MHQGLFEPSRDSIPDVPALVPKLMMLPEDASRHDIVALLREDAELCEAVLHIAKKPYYSGRRPITNISRLVDRIGLSGVRGLALQAALARAVFNKPSATMQDMWKHSLATAYITRVICQHAAVHSETAFAVALLQHVGLALPLALNEVSDDDMWERLEYAHEAIAGFLVKSWSLPESLCTAVLQHHRLGAGVASDEIVATLIIADFIANNMERGLEPWVHPPPLESDVEAALAHLDLSATRLPVIERAAATMLQSTET